MHCDSHVKVRLTETETETETDTGTDKRRLTDRDTGTARQTEADSGRPSPPCRWQHSGSITSGWMRMAKKKRPKSTACNCRQCLENSAWHFFLWREDKNVRHLRRYLYLGVAQAAWWREGESNLLQDQRGDIEMAVCRALR